MSGNRSPETGDVLRHIGITAIVAAVAATVFTAWRPASLEPGEIVRQLIGVVEGQEDSAAGPVVVDPAETNLQIGIVAGHSGFLPDTDLTDPGATCPDGLTEAEINRSIAELAVQGLNASGQEAVLLEEFDERLVGFRGIALISIHADSCSPINDEATGYKVAAAVDTVVPDKSQRLVLCLVDRYGQATGLNFHAGSVTRDMTEYHTFYEIHNQTPAAIIEAGFLFLDRDFLTKSPNLAARGIVDALLCYVNNEPTDFNLTQP
jgi:N-acetylmuramoyl-L-alanine amidase